MKFRLSLLSILFIPLASEFNLCNADEKAKLWSGEGSLNANVTTGSANVTNLGFGIKLQRMINDWTVKLDASASYGKANKLKNKDQSEFSIDFEYDIGKKLSAHAKANYRTNQFANFRYKSVVGAGLGYTIYKGEEAEWSIKSSLGAKIEKSKPPTSSNGVTQGNFDKQQTHANLNIESTYLYNFSDEVKFEYELEAGLSDGNVDSESNVSLSSQISGALSAKFSYQLRNEYETTTDDYSTETETVFALIYKF